VVYPLKGSMAYRGR